MTSDYSANPNIELSSEVIQMLQHKSLKQKIDNAIIKVILQESDESGYTIIESLVAMIVVAVLMSAIAPVIALSVGTRVQAKRVELASQAAKSYIDWVRSDIEKNTPPNYIGVDLDDAPAPDPTSGSLDCNDNLYCTSPPQTKSSLFCVNGDDTPGCSTDSLTDMIVQGVRRYGNISEGYVLGVRVYRADAFKETTLCGPQTQSCPTEQSTITNAIGNRRLPVLQLTTEIAPTQNSFENLCDRLKGGCNNN